MTDSNIQPPSDPNAHVYADGTTAVPNPIPGIEVTQTPGLIPETTVPTPVTGGVTGSAITEGRPDLGPDTTYTENDGSSGNIAPPPLNIPNVVLPPSVTGTEWDGTAVPLAGQPDITEVPPTDYAAAVDNLVNEMPVATEAQQAHQEMMHQPAYAIATHEHQLNKISDLLEELCTRVVSIEEKINQHETNHHYGGSPGLTV